MPLPPFEPFLHQRNLVALFRLLVGVKYRKPTVCRARARWKQSANHSQVEAPSSLGPYPPEHLLDVFTVHTRHCQTLYQETGVCLGSPFRIPTELRTGYCTDPLTRTHYRDKRPTSSGKRNVSAEKSAEFSTRAQSKGQNDFNKKPSGDNSRYSATYESTSPQIGRGGIYGSVANQPPITTTEISAAGPGNRTHSHAAFGKIGMELSGPENVIHTVPPVLSAAEKRTQLGRLSAKTSRRL